MQIDRKLHSLDHLKQLEVGHFNVPRHVPGQMHHGNHRFDALEFVPLITFDGQLVLIRCRKQTNATVT